MCIIARATFPPTLHLPLKLIKRPCSGLPPPASRPMSPGIHHSRHAVPTYTCMCHHHTHTHTHAHAQPDVAFL